LLKIDVEFANQCSFSNRKKVKEAKSTDLVQTRVPVVDDPVFEVGKDVCERSLVFRRYRWRY
jgi:hypothetical protein